MPEYSEPLVSTPLLEGLWKAATFDSAIEQCTAALEAEMPAETPKLTAMLDAAQVRLELYIRQHSQNGPHRALALNAEFKLRGGPSMEAAGLLLDADIVARGKRVYRARLLEIIMLQERRDTARFFALKWLKNRSHTGIYWWFYASLVDTPEQYRILCEIVAKPAKNSAAGVALKEMRTRSIARAAYKTGDFTTAYDLYIGLLQDGFSKVDTANLKSLSQRHKTDKSTLHFLHVPLLSAVEKNHNPTPADIAQALFEQTKQGNWQVVLNIIKTHSAILKNHDSLLTKLQALAEKQLLCGWPTAQRPNDGVVKASALLAEGLDHFWLDSGSLLGVARSGKPIDWDSDIDFGIWSDAVPALLTLLNKLSDKGYWVSHRRYYGHVYGATLKIPGARTIHIHVYYRSADGKQACSPQTLCYYKPASRTDEATPFQDYPWTRKVLCKLHNAAISPHHNNPLIHFVKKRILRRGWGLFVRIRSKVKREKWTTMYPFKALYATGTWVIPAQYFDTLTHMQVDSAMVPVPKDIDGYLTFRYAQWRIPVQEWCYWLDDGGQTPKSPTDLGFDDLFDPVGKLNAQD